MPLNWIYSPLKNKLPDPSHCSPQSPETTSADEVTADTKQMRLQNTYRQRKLLWNKVQLRMHLPATIQLGSDKGEKKRVKREKLRQRQNETEKLTSMSTRTFQSDKSPSLRKRERGAETGLLWERTPDVSMRRWERNEGEVFPATKRRNQFYFKEIAS